MNIFSYRAELPCDADRFFDALARAEIVVCQLQRSHDPYNTYGEFQCPFDDVTVNQLYGATGHIPDIHVLLGTLRAVPLTENTLPPRLRGRIGHASAYSRGKAGHSTFIWIGNSAGHDNFGSDPFSGGHLQTRTPMGAR